MRIDRDKVLACLIDHQKRALEIIKRGDVLLAPDAWPDPGKLSQSRWELVRVLGAYQAFKHHELFNPLIRGGTPEQIRVALQMKDECIEIGDDFRAHAARCANLDIAAHWAEYRPTVATLLRRIQAHLSRELWVIESMLLPRVAR